MHFVIATENIPNPNFGGGALTGWSVIQALKKRGHQVTACMLLPSSGGGTDREMEEIVKLGVAPLIFRRGPSRSNIGTFFKEIGAIIPPSIRTFYPIIERADEIGKKIDSLKPDAVFAYDFAPIAATSKVKLAPRLGIGGSFRPLTSVYRWRYCTPFHLNKEYFIQTIFALISKLEYRYMVELLSHCESSGHFAAHHAKMLEDMGVKNCKYYQTPVIDMLDGAWQSFNEEREKKLELAQKPKILTVGHLRGISTLAGLYVIAKEVMPQLEKSLGADGFELHIVGRYDPPDDLKKTLARPSVHLRGFVDDLKAEYTSSHVCLVPGDVEFSVRVRILTAFSFGACVVAHRANSPGIPEMLHEENSLQSGDGKGLAEAIIRAIGDAGLRKRMEINARQTYEKAFSPEVAGGKIADELERLAKIRKE